jgi:putative endonuclease
MTESINILRTPDLTHNSAIAKFVVWPLTQIISSTFLQAKSAGHCMSASHDLIRRIFDHKSNVVDGFTKKYSIHHLVYFEQFDDIENAIKREKRIKKWNRNWKIRLIEESNPNWTDLYPNLARQ